MPYPTPASLQCFGWHAVSIALKPDFKANYTNSAVFYFFQAVPQKMEGKAFISWYIIMRMQYYNSQFYQNKLILLMQNLQELLIESKIAYPKYYNGYSWNTIIDKNRKNIPSYLKSDLPSLKLIPIRQQFNKISTIECPRLTFFKPKIIKSSERNHSNHKEQKSKDIKVPNTVYMQEIMQKHKKELKNIKLQIQYSLITTDKNSNVIKRLLQKAEEIETEVEIIKEKTKYKNTQRRKSRSVLFNKQEFFENTLELVFLSKKQNLLKMMSKKEEQINIKHDNKIQEIELLPYI